MSDTPTPVIETWCAWCKALIHAGVLVDGMASHGMCKACAAKFRKETRQFCREARGER